jgi:glycosyltransferase involved in cell wall biosynthesis
VAYVFRKVIEQLEATGVDVRTVVLDATSWPLASALRASWTVRSQLRDATVVHLEFGSNDTEIFWFAFVAVLFRRDCVVVAHDYPQFAHTPAAGLVGRSTRLGAAIGWRLLSPLLDRPVVSIVIRRAGALAVFSRDARRAWRAKGAKHVEVLTLGADQPLGPILPPSRGECVLFAGFVGPHKGVDVLLDAWERVGGSVQLPLLIAGEVIGEYVEWAAALRRRASKFANPPRFLGYVPTDAMFQDLVNHAAVVVLPYRFSSPASGVLVRAMASGRAVITTDVPAAKTTVQDGWNGIIIPMDDSVTLADAIMSLCHAPAERDRLGRTAARSARAHFTWQCHIDGLRRAYDAAQARKPVRG